MLAALGAGVWSLVTGQIVGAAAYAAALLTLAPYRVRPAFDRVAAARGIQEGRGFLVQTVTGFAAQNVDILIVGRVLGAARLGFYSMAIRISELPSWVIAESVAKVTFPGFARMRHRGEDVTPAFLSALKLVAFAACPLGVILSGAAEPVVLVVFGERWAGMIGPLAVLGVWGAVKPIRNTIAWLLNSVGHQAVLGRISLVMLVLLIPLVHVAASRGGITEVAWVVLAESVAATVALAWFARSRAGVSLARQWSALAVVALACPGAWVASRLVAEATADLVGVLALGLPLAAGLGAYLAVILLFDRRLPGHALGQARRMVGKSGRRSSRVRSLPRRQRHRRRPRRPRRGAGLPRLGAGARRAGACELLLVDNGSTDGTAAAVAEAFPAAEVVRLPRNIGVAARNEGLRRASGRLRMFLDSDARLTPGALADLVGYLDANAGVGLVGPRLVYEDGTLQLSARRYPPVLVPLPPRPPLGRYLGGLATVGAI